MEAEVWRRKKEGREGERGGGGGKEERDGERIGDFWMKIPMACLQAASVAVHFPSNWSYAAVFEVLFLFQIKDEEWTPKTKGIFLTGLG